MYNAMHVRRGDHTDYYGRNPRWYGRKMKSYGFKQPVAGSDKPADVVYVATDEKKRSWFNDFKRQGYTLKFASDLNQEVLLSEVARFPAEMRMDVLGFLEQMLAARAARFLGCHGSTFTTSIQFFRKNYHKMLLDE